MFAALALSVVCAPIASADTVTGRLTTGIGGSNGSEVNGVVIAPPIASPTGGVYTSAQSVTLSAPGASSIRFTTDGSAPTCATGTVYTSAIDVSASLVIQARSCYTGSASSTVASYLYAINPASTGGNGNGGGGGGGGGGSGGTGGSSLQGDANSDSKVNVLDFVTLMADWGSTQSNDPADFNKDGKVDVQDFVILMANWTA